METVLTTETILNLISHHCSHIDEQLKKHELTEMYYDRVNIIRRGVDVNFALSNDSSLPKNFIR